MIYTVTLNPSIDFIVHVDHLQIGDLNRITWRQRNQRFTYFKTYGDRIHCLRFFRWFYRLIHC